MTEPAERTLGSFPAEWGTPPGGQFSEERAAWVAERVREHQSLAAVRKLAVRKVAEAQARARGAEHVRRQRALLMRRRYT